MKESKSRTITTYFRKGTPKSIHSISLSYRPIRAYVVPRSEIKECSDWDDLSTPCLYVLFGKDDNGKDKAYIGQAENFQSRVIDHNRKKDFWERAVVFVSSEGAISKSEVLYLEFLAIEQAKKAQQYVLDENIQNPRPHALQQHLKDPVEEFFEDVMFITEFAGYTLFREEAIVEIATKEGVINTEIATNDLFFLKSKSTDAKGFYDANGFTVLKGSLLEKDAVSSLRLKGERDTFLQDYTTEAGNARVLTVNHTFSSPSAAAMFCTGSPMNGWDKWINGDGKTLKEIYRS